MQYVNDIILDTSVFVQKTKEDVLAKFKMNDSIDSLTINDSGWNDLTGLDEISSRIKSLYVKDVNVSYVGLENFSNLEYFKSETEFPHLFVRMDSVNKLHVAWNKQYFKTFFNAFPNVKELLIRYFSGNSCKEFSEFSHLEILNLVQGKLRSTDGISTCKNLKKIYFANLRSLENTDDFKYIDQIEYIFLENIPKIKEIFLSSMRCCSLLRFEKMAQLNLIEIKKDANVNEIFLADLPKINSLDFMSAIKSLKKITIGNCKSIEFLDMNLNEVININIDIPVKNLESALLENKETIGIGNVLSDFSWLTKNHMLKNLYIKYTGTNIDWEALFSLPSIEFIHIECVKKLDIELSFEDIQDVARKYGKKISSGNEFKTRYPFYRLRVD